MPALPRVFEMMMMAYRQIPTMTKTHHGGNLSVMMVMMTKMMMMMMMMQYAYSSNSI